MPRALSASVLATASAVMLAAACGRGAATAAVPQADLIVATPDSSFWVTSAPQGLRVRGAPILLARVDGRYREIYVADDDRSYYDAVLVGQRLWSRDLIRGDSVELFADTVVPRYAAAYAKSHPDDRPLEKDDDASDHPRATVTADLEVLGVHGPYVSYEYRTDMDVAGGRDAASRHTARRGVLDARTGRTVTVADLFGKEAAARLASGASDEWTSARDSLLALRDRRSRRAQRAIATFAFDPASFTIDSYDGKPQVVYAVPGAASRGSLSAIELEARDTPAPAWWGDVRDELPDGPDSLLTWKHGALTLRAELAGDADVARLTLRDSSARRDWRVGVVSAPVWRVLWLDAGLSADDRKALKRAFNDASMYSDDSRIAAARERRPRARVPVFPASYVRTR